MVHNTYKKKTSRGLLHCWRNWRALQISAYWGADPNSQGRAHEEYKKELDPETKP
jgi:hypothetical protein